VEFHGVEAGGLRPTNAAYEGQVDPEKAEIGGEAKHGA
jgi:hypothetical protein